VNKIYKVFWSQTALDELSNIVAYPPEVKERIYLDAHKRLSFMPTLTAKQVPNGILKDYWVRLGLYQVILIFEVNEEQLVVWIDGIKHKREDVTGKGSRHFR